MAKKDIGKILNTGTAKQKILLIAEDTARGKYFMDRLLTDSEFNQLSESFKKPNEIKLWNEFMRLDDTFTTAIVNLQGLLFEVKMHYSNLRGYIITWNSIENAELLVNSVLHEVKDVKRRKRLAEDGAKGINLLFSKTEIDQEGYIDIKIDFESEAGRDEKPNKTDKYSLWYVMNNVKKQAAEAAIKYISWESAILDHMEETGFNVKTYKEKIKEMTSQVYEPVIGWAKYSGEISIETASPRIKEIIKKYAICPQVEDYKVDEVEYNWFKKTFFNE